MQDGRLRRQRERFRAFMFRPKLRQLRHGTTLRLLPFGLFLSFLRRLAEGTKAVFDARCSRRNRRHTMKSKRASNAVPEGEADQNHQEDTCPMARRDPLTGPTNDIQREPHNSCRARLLPYTIALTRYKASADKTPQFVTRLPVAGEINECKD